MVVTGLVVVVVVIVGMVCFDIGGLVVMVMVMVVVIVKVVIVVLVPTGRYLIISLHGPRATLPRQRRERFPKLGQRRLWRRWL